MNREKRNEILERLDVMEDVMVMTDEEISKVYKSDRQTIILNQITSLKAYVVS
jgi:hypothetical protein